MSKSLYSLANIACQALLVSCANADMLNTTATRIPQQSENHYIFQFFNIQNAILFLILAGFILSIVKLFQLKYTSKKSNTVSKKDTAAQIFKNIQKEMEEERRKQMEREKEQVTNDFFEKVDFLEKQLKELFENGKHFETQLENSDQLDVSEKSHLSESFYSIVREFTLSLEHFINSFDVGQCCRYLCVNKENNERLKNLYDNLYQILQLSKKFPKNEDCENYVTALLKIGYFWRSFKVISEEELNALLKEAGVLPQTN